MDGVGGGVLGRDLIRQGVVARCRLLVSGSGRVSGGGRVGGCGRPRPDSDAMSSNH